MTESHKSFPVVCFGEILWDVLPDKALPGGAPMNVAYHLSKLGVSPALITRVGNDLNGEKLINLLSANNLPLNYIQIDENYKTGVVYACIGNHNEVTYDIVKPVAWDFIEWKNEYTELLQNGEYFIFGSLTSRSKISRDTLMHLLEVAKTKVLDINLRPPHFLRTDIEYLLRKANILKMNLAELELVTGWFGKFQTDEQRIQLIQDRFQINTVIVTMGGDGAIVNHKGSIYRHNGFKVTVADTIGSGDSFLAGFLQQLIEGESIDKALSFASAIGAFIATKCGACPQYEIKEINDLMNSTASFQTRIIYNH
jgi:fructokinase